MDNQHCNLNQLLTNAIISKNTQALQNILSSQDFQNHQEQPAKFYEQLKLTNVPLTPDMDILFQDFLLNARFYTPKKTSRKNPNLTEVRDYLKTTQKLIEEFTELTESDCKFLFYVKQLVENIRFLKRHLRSTYQEIPWEEMEFCLVIFIKTVRHPEESDLLYKVTVTNLKVLKYLKEFGNYLFNLEVRLTIKDLRDVTVTGREAYVKKISSASEVFRQLYEDYDLIRTIYSLCRVQKYLDLAHSKKIDPNDSIGRLIIQRALQVTGECLKNSPTSPNVSIKVQKLLVNVAPKNLKEITGDVRLSLSHAKNLLKKIGLEEIDDKKYFENLQSDLKKIDIEIRYVLYKIRLEGVKTFLTKIVNTNEKEEMNELCEKFGELENSEFDPGNFEDPFLHRLQNYIREIQEFLGETNEETENKFEKIAEIFKSIETKVKELKNKYKREASRVVTVIRSIKYAKELTTMQRLADNCLQSISRDNQLKSVRGILDVIQTIFEQHKNLPVTLLTQIQMIIEFEFGRIDQVNEFKDDLIQDFCDSTVEDVVNEIGFFLSDDKRRLFLDEVESKKKRHLGKERLKIMKFDDPENLNSFNEIINCFGSKERDKLKKLIALKKFDECLILVQKIDDSYQALLSDLSETHFFSLNKYKKTVTNFLSSIKVKKDIFVEFQKATEKYIKNLESLIEKQYKNRLQLLSTITTKTTKTAIINDDCKITSIEMILLDLMEILENLDLLDEAKLFFEQYSPILIGKNLRNFLAHGDVYLEQFPIDPKIGIICNAYRLIEEGELILKTTNKLIGGCQYVPTKNRFENNCESLSGINEMFLAIKESRFFKCDVDLRVKMRNYFLENGMHIAAKFNNIEAFKFFSKYNDLDLKDIYGNEAIIFAATHGSLDVIKYLLIDTKQKDINSKYKREKTLLHYAVKNNQIEIVEFLLANKAKFEENPEFIRIIHSAAINNNSKILKLLLNEGMDPNSQYLNSLTPLHAAAFPGSLETIDLLLEHGAAIDAKNNYLWTPLYLALLNKEEAACLLLLSRGADVKCRDEDGMTPLHLAMTIGNLKIAKALIDRGADVNSTDFMGNSVLHFAATFKFAEAVEMLLKNGAEINIVNHTGGTPLHFAAVHVDAKCAEILVENGAEVDKPEKEHITPLQVASEKGSELIVEILLKRNANVEAADNNFCTSLYKAAKNNHISIVMLLIKFGANINTSNIHKWTPLHVATSYGYNEIIEKLLSIDSIDVFAKTVNGWTALHMASLAGFSEAASELLTNTYTTNQLTDNEGRTPLHFAALENQIEVAKILLTKISFLIEIKDHQGRTPLHLACQKGHIEITTFLLEKKADVNTKDFEAFTPLHFASRFGHKTIVAELLRNGADPNALSKSNFTASHLAAMTGRINVLKLLPVDSSILHQVMQAECLEFLLNNFELDVNVRCERGRTPLHTAAVAGNVAVVRLLMEKGAMVDVVDASLNTPLLLAVKAKSYSAVEVLLENGACVNFAGENKVAPLHFVTMEASNEHLKIILQREININQKMDFGLTALHLAVSIGNVGKLLMLLDKNADINATDDISETPLHKAINSNHEAIVEILLSKGVDVNFQNCEGSSPLHVAVAKNNISVVNLLLKHNDVDLCLKDKFGNNPLHIALFNCFDDVTFDILLHKRAIDICNEKGYENYTPIQIAAKNGNMKILEILLEMGAKVTDKNNHATVLHFGVYSGKLDIVKKIMEYVSDCEKDKVLNVVDGDGDSSLMWAIEIGAVDILDYLLKIRSDPFQKNANGLDAFDWSEKFGNENVIEVLKNWKCNKNIFSSK